MISILQNFVCTKEERLEVLRKQLPLMYPINIPHMKDTKRNKICDVKSINSRIS